MARYALRPTVPAYAVLVGLETNAPNESAGMNIGGQIVRKFATARTTTQNSVIHGLENAFAKPDGTVTLVAGLVRFIGTARAVKIAAIARTTHSARL